MSSRVCSLFQALSLTAFRISASSIAITHTAAVALLTEMNALSLPLTSPMTRHANESDTPQPGPTCRFQPLCKASCEHAYWSNENADVGDTPGLETVLAIHRCRHCRSVGGHADCGYGKGSPLLLHRLIAYDDNCWQQHAKWLHTQVNTNRCTCREAWDEQMWKR